MTSLTSEQQDLMERAKSAAQRSSHATQPALDISGTQGEKLQVNRVEFSVRDWVRRVVTTMSTPARENGVELQTDIAVDFPEQLVGDPDLLRRVLQTLIRDAIDASPLGKVILVMRLDRRAIMMMAVEAFRCFFQSKGGCRTGMRRKSITQIIANATGYLASWAGGFGLMALIRGARPALLTIRLGLTSAVDETSPVSPGSTSGSWALLVESSSTGQIALLPVLEKQGLRYLLASSGREAIALLERFELDFVILCLEPSTMDGLEASG
jgi:hypothetical protein